MEKSHFNLLMSQFLFSKYKIIKWLHVLNDVCWAFDQRNLNFKNTWKKNWHLSDFISTIRLWNRHDLWNMRVDSRTKKKDCQTKRAPIEFAKSWQKWHQYFSTLLKNLSSWVQYIGLEKEKQAVFKSPRGNKKKWWLNDEYVKLRTMVLKGR